MLKPPVSSNVKPAASTRFQGHTVKRAFDVMVILGTLAVLLPLLLLLALAVRLDSPGRVFFRHLRVGRSGREFYVLKFRTMRQDSETTLAHHLNARSELAAEWERDRKLKNDPRVTRVGRWLRRSSLDELPQIYNILRGDMSLVGPRPIVRDEVSKYEQHFGIYTEVRPGLTGLWQVSGRNDVDYTRRVALDVHYVQHWSFWLDLLILFRTVGVVLFSRGAY